MKKKKLKSVEVFMDGVDFQHEIGHASGGNTVYPSLGDALKNSPCAKSCGIVRVKVELVDWVLEQNWDNAEYVSFSSEELRKDPDIQSLECASAHLGYLEERVEKQKNKIEVLKQKISDKSKA